MRPDARINTAVLYNTIEETWLCYNIKHDLYYWSDTDYSYAINVHLSTIQFLVDNHLLTSDDISRGCIMVCPVIQINQNDGMWGSIIDYGNAIVLNEYMF